MDVSWIDGYCKSKNGAECVYKDEWEATVYRISGKMFAMRGEDKTKRPILSLKCEPTLAINYRENYADVNPGYYLNKEHWNSIYLDGDFSEDLLKSMIDMSFELVYKSLTKKARASLEI